MIEEGLTIGRLWRAGRDVLMRAEIESAALDAKLLAGLALSLDTAGLVVNEHQPVTPDQHQAFTDLIARRLSREPVARILGHKEFYSLNFRLNEATLVPRPETEMLVDLGLKHLAGVEKPQVLDLGTGTGCIIISLLAHHREAQAIATDFSSKAIEQARENAKLHEVSSRLALRQGDWFEALAENDGPFDLIVSNPPYIPHRGFDGLEDDVKAHDPHLALDGGPDGLTPYRLIARQARARLRPNGLLLVEHGAGQGRAVVELFRAAGFITVTQYDDLAGHDRVVAAGI